MDSESESWEVHRGPSSIAVGEALTRKGKEPRVIFLKWDWEDCRQPAVSQLPDWCSLNQKDAQARPPFGQCRRQAYFGFFHSPSGETICTPTFKELPETSIKDTPSSLCASVHSCVHTGVSTGANQSTPWLQLLQKKVRYFHAYYSREERLFKVLKAMCGLELSLLLQETKEFT